MSPKDVGPTRSIWRHKKHFSAHHRLSAHRSVSDIHRSISDTHLNDVITEYLICIEVYLIRIAALCFREGPVSEHATGVCAAGLRSKWGWLGT